jgi:protocatechuate 3,4-dioxygenase beta subunit
VSPSGDISLHCPLFALLLLIACAADAAVIKGIVLDNLTGRPLARTRVFLEAVEGGGAAAKSTSTGSNGQFEFPKLAAGWYLVSAERLGFNTVRHGQKFWNSPGVPLRMEADASQFLSLRMKRLGAITGTVLDENEVGLPQVSVMAYRDGRPPVLAGRTRADDLGLYRVGMLAPGRYFVRTGPKPLSEDFNLAPTFHRETLRLDEALPVEVRMEEQSGEVNVKPVPGKLVTLGVQIRTPGAGSVPLTLVSEMGRIRGVTNAQGIYTFPGLAPGRYELFAGNQSAEPHTGPYGRYRADPYASYRSLYLMNEGESCAVLLTPVAAVTQAVEDQSGNSVYTDKVIIWMRRKDLAGVREAQRLPGRVVTLPPGPWEVRVETPPEMYPVSVSISGTRQNTAVNVTRADGWTEVYAPDYGSSSLRVIVSRRPAAIHGKVTTSLGDAVVGAPVYLEAWDDREDRRLGEIRQTRADAHGVFRFGGLAPGVYRIISSFDFEAPDAELMQALSPKTVKAGEGEDAAADLTLCVSQ